MLIIEFCGQKLKDYKILVQLTISIFLVELSKVTEKSSPITITHLDDFKIHFPDIDLPPPTDAS